MASKALPIYSVSHSPQTVTYYIRNAHARGFRVVHLDATAYRVPLKSGGWNLHPRTHAGFQSAIRDAFTWGPSLRELPEGEHALRVGFLPYEI